MIVSNKSINIFLITCCAIAICQIREIYSCEKGIFHELFGKRGEGHIILDINNTSYSQCLRACRLMMKCYRFNFGGTETENGRCQLLGQYTALTIDVRWSYYANCPDGMEFFETTGSCYTLTSSCSSFYDGRTICTSWAPGVHVVDVYTEAENDIVKNYRLLTGKFFTVI
ncbi:hypothetical protein LSH36_119g04005 [Paralvinella palmiformis]|uniref:Apple domain-containing protein n=1 Tax=Paralvinella palmiformis TaxID=53620 RepID=A0AAD9JYH8_9ANNE|nr:hypothetical protein LSH36_119g04005 [Paralvinella palmiformis]